MRTITTALLAIVCLTANAQSNWEELFRSDPERSNGYFILDQDKAGAMGVTEVKVYIMAAEIQANGSVNTSLVESLNIDDELFAHLDFELWETLSDPYRVYWHAEGLDALGNVVVDVQSFCDDCDPWPELCRETCEANLYAYTLVAYSNGAQAFIDIQSGTTNEELAFVYVKASEWSTFTNMFDPWDDFGIGGGEWSEIITNDFQTAVIRLDYPDQTPPPGARDYQGYLLGWVTQDVYAVAKGKGPWRDLYAHTDNMAAQAVCMGAPGHLRPIYNADALVQNALAINDMDPLVCSGLMMSGTGLSWGSGYLCPEYYIGVQDWGDPPNYLGNITMTAIGCVSIIFDTTGVTPGLGSGPSGEYALADVANIVVHQWTPNGRDQVMSVPVNGIGDPRLWEVMKVEVPGGLYEFRVIMNNGRMMKRFVDFDGPTTLSADFAAFTHINIYPVPVRDDRFAIDLDLGMPLDINLTIVNNLGTTYYTKALSFPLSGLNKHIVEMESAWAEGLYHAVFQYEDGSTESVSFTVDY